MTGSADTGRAATAQADRLLRDLDASQRQAVTSPARPLAILAPAGSGKTRVLTRRIAWRVVAGDADPSHVLALTFTRRAAGELRQRLAGLGLHDGVAAGTFHGVAYAQLRGWWTDQGRQPPALLGRKAGLLGDVLEAAGARSPTAVQLAAEIEWAKARLVGPDAYPDAARQVRRRTPAPATRVAELYARYEELKRRRRLIDLDDLLRLCSHLIETEPAFAGAQRWRFRHLFVDELQDVNPLQMQLLEAWRGEHVDLCAVGDPRQAIYGWNGADPGFLERFQELYPSAEVITLERNYRSTPQVLAAAADVLRAARGQGGPDRPVEAVRGDGQRPRLARHASDRDEARALARAVRDLHAPGSSWAAQAVLTRTNAQLPLLAEALRAVGVPHRVRGSQDLLGRPEVREALNRLRRSDRPLSAHLPDLKTPVEGDARGAEEAETGDAQTPLELLASLARDQLRLDPHMSAPGFVAWLTATFDAEAPDPAGDAVTLATFHAAKGLEWPVVHLAGLEDGFVPITHARSQAAQAEEARLLYVAMTRASDVLRCSWAASRSFGGELVPRQVSPWLRSLAERQRDDAEPPPPPADWRQRLASGRASLAQAERPVPEQLAALRAWREDAARAARVEPPTLIDDALLEDIARRRPATRDELAAVPGMGRLLAKRVGDGLLAALHRDRVQPPDRV